MAMSPVSPQGATGGLAARKGGTVIVDSHVYCFEALDRPAGHASGRERLNWVQASHGLHHQPAWRVRDRAPAPSSPLNPAGVHDLTKLPDVAFRADRERGRLVWTVDGEDYTKQFFPPALRDLEFTPHLLMAEMDYAGVDAALIHTDPMLGRDVEYLSECVRLYPDRLRAMAPVDEWRLTSELDAVVKDLTYAIEVKGLHAIKFIPPLAYINGDMPWDDGPYRPFWEAAVGLGVPVFFTLGSGPPRPAGLSPQQERDGYVGELRILMRWMERYPDAVCSLTHGFPWRAFIEDGRVSLPDEVWEPFSNPKCSLEVCIPVRVGDMFEYPYHEMQPVVQEMVERIGADQLLWGTDMPFQNRFCTYGQSRAWLERHCGLGRDELESLMGGTAARVLCL